MSSEVRRFFRHCPGCGRRFEIRLVGRKLVEIKEETADLVPPVSSFEGSAAYTQPYVVRQPAGHVILRDASPMTIDVAQFSCTYKCARCGHEWTEER